MMFREQQSLAGYVLLNLQQREPDLLVEPGLVKHGVFEVDFFHRSITAELDIVTNCINMQFQLPLCPLNHRAGRLGICLYHLCANCEFLTLLFKTVTISLHI